MKTKYLSDALWELFDFVTDLPSGLDGFDTDFDLAFVELRNIENPWINVEKKLPEDTLEDKDTKVIHCLVAIGPPRSQPKRKPLVTKAQRQWNSWTKSWEWGRVSGVTHWMPLPEPPGKE